MYNASLCKKSTILVPTTVKSESFVCNLRKKWSCNHGRDSQWQQWKPDVAFTKKP